MNARRYLTLSAGLLIVAGLATAAVWSAPHDLRDLHGADWRATRDGATPRLPAAVASAPSVAPWVGWTPGGVKVTVAPDSLPIPLGIVDLEIRTDPAVEADTRVTLDLASPTMPMHGVTRFAAVHMTSGVFRSRVTIPMEGEWVVAVNVGSDFDAAEVSLVVPAPHDAGSAAHVHAGHRP